MKAAHIGAFAILGLGLVALSVTTHQIPLGPMPEIERDPLKFTAAFWSKDADALILVRDHSWTKIDLHAATVVGKQFKYDIMPQRENSFSIGAFHSGAPGQDVLSGFVEVPVLTREYASFAYKWNGEPWHDHSRRVTPPAPLRVGLYRSQGRYAADNRTFWGSYIFALPEAREDKRFGVEFFYYPGTKTEISWHAPRLFPYGPSLLAVCLLIYCLPVPLQKLGVTVLALVALGLHAFSSLIILWAVRYGEAWSGQGTNHGMPFGYALVGLAIIGPLVIVKYATIRRKAPNSEGSTQRVLRCRSAPRDPG